VDALISKLHYFSSTDSQIMFLFFHFFLSTTTRCNLLFLVIALKCHHIDKSWPHHFCLYVLAFFLRIPFVVKRFDIDFSQTSFHITACFLFGINGKHFLLVLQLHHR